MRVIVTVTVAAASSIFRDDPTDTPHIATDTMGATLMRRVTGAGIMAGEANTEEWIAKSMASAAKAEK